MTFALTADGLTAFRRQLRANDAVAVEAGQAAYYFYDHIHERVKEVVLVNPHRFALISDFVAQFPGVTPAATMGPCPKPCMSFVIASAIGGSIIVP